MTYHPPIINVTAEWDEPIGWAVTENPDSFDEAVHYGSDGFLDAVTHARNVHGVILCFVDGDIWDASHTRGFMS